MKAIELIEQLNKIPEYTEVILSTKRNKYYTLSIPDSATEIKNRFIVLQSEDISERIVHRQIKQHLENYPKPFKTINEIKERKKNSEYTYVSIESDIIKDYYFIGGYTSDLNKEKSYNIFISTTDGMDMIYNKFTTKEQANEFIKLLPLHFPIAFHLFNKCSVLGFIILALKEPYKNKNSSHSMESISGACTWICKNIEKINFGNRLFDEIYNNIFNEVSKIYHKNINTYHDKKELSFEELFDIVNKHIFEMNSHIEYLYSDANTSPPEEIYFDHDLRGYMDDDWDSYISDNEDDEEYDNDYYLEEYYRELEEEDYENCFNELEKHLKGESDDDENEPIYPDDAEFPF